MGKAKKGYKIPQQRGQKDCHREHLIKLMFNFLPLAFSG